MTQEDKDIVIAEIERLKEIGCPLQKGSDYQHGYDEFYTQIKTFINSLPTEQPSEDLEEASNKYANDHTGLCIENDGGLYEDFDKPKRDFIAGANWQKEQMLKGLCYESKVYRDEEGDGIDTPIESWLALENNEITNLPNIGLKEGDKVKILIIKEDEQCNTE